MFSLTQLLLEMVKKSKENLNKGIKFMEVRFMGCDQSPFCLLNKTGHGILKIVFT